MMWRLGGCERCHGDLRFVYDEWWCFQCGRQAYVIPTSLKPPDGRQAWRANKKTKEMELADVLGG